MARAYSAVTGFQFDTNSLSFTKFSRNNFCTTSVPKQETTVTPVTRPPDYDPLTPIVKVESEEELQDEWKSLERRVANRKTKANDGNAPTGRGKRNSSAWDAENNEVQ